MVEENNEEEEKKPEMAENHPSSFRCSVKQDVVLLHPDQQSRMYRVKCCTG